MKLIVLTPDHQVFEGLVSLVKVPGTTGYFEVLSGHAPIVSSLSKGVVKFKEKNGNEKTFTIEDGFIEVLNNEISLLVTGVKE
jgi:F-type H+-transporting ATPase subunit epsilon